MSERSEFITAYDAKLQKEVQITRKMQSILPKRYQIVGETSQVQKKSPAKGAAPVAGRKPKIIRKDEI
jgi:hypothetical protein